MPSIPKLKFTEGNNFFLIAGPCVVEGEKIVFETAGEIQRIADQLEIPFIFKSSFKKANRSKSDSFTGIGDELALSILRKAGIEFNIPTLTDIHETSDAALAAEYVDVLQIPAFLCRQTDLLTAAGKTGKAVNIKKGQFLAPEQMQFAAQKVQDAGNENIFLTDRGVTFGYQDLIVDYRGIPIMQRLGYPVVLDCTHSLQKPNQAIGVTGGIPEMIEIISKAGIAVGVDGLFIETHPDPSKAKSDGANMLSLSKLKGLLEKLVKIRKALQ
ncbi:MAG: 3-deoxy-8-phosphooctulonate synthase [Chitinophagales bacterium]|nr:3-deoxy-8-phosphooctulonate synthase [Chitinophagales bacterium]